jgi:hypothetical protein
LYEAPSQEIFSTASPKILFCFFSSKSINMAGLSSDTIQTLVLLWVFTWLAMALMVSRLAMRKLRGQALQPGDKITVVCMVCLLARLAFIHVVLVWGSNNVSEGFRAKHTFTQTEIYQREIGSKLTLVSRTFYNT